MIKKEIQINNINVTVEQKNIKNMYLRVLPPHGEIKVSAPLHVKEEDIINFITSRQEWILEKQKYIQDHNIKPPLKYMTGETHYLWGKPYILQLVKKDKMKNILIDNNDSIIYLPNPKRSTIKKRETILNELYRNELKKKIPKVLNKCTKIVGRSPKDITVRNMKNWGNCKQDGRITLNLKLAKKDPICLEYVLIHELCHLIEFNHGKKFKELMDKNCPDWKKIKKMLNE